MRPHPPPSHRTLAAAVLAAALAFPAAVAADVGPGLAPTPGSAATAVAAVKPPACPPYIIVGVYRPSEAIAANGCLFASGHPGPLVVRFYRTAAGVPLRAGQATRFERARGYYAYPP